MLLPDVNVWLALAFDAHTHHLAAKRWIEGLSNELCFFCRMTQQGFLRLATNPSVLGADAVSLSQAWQVYDTTLSDQRVSYAEEPVGLESLWRSYTQGKPFSPKLWNDAYLAAFAVAGEFGFVTFDKGLVQYKNLNCLVLA